MNHGNVRHKNGPIPQTASPSVVRLKNAHNEQAARLDRSHRRKVLLAPRVRPARAHLQTARCDPPIVTTACHMFQASFRLRSLFGTSNRKHHKHKFLLKDQTLRYLVTAPSYNRIRVYADWPGLKVLSRSATDLKAKLIAIIQIDDPVKKEQGKTESLVPIKDPSPPTACVHRPLIGSRRRMARPGIPSACKIVVRAIDLRLTALPLQQSFRLAFEAMNHEDPRDLVTEVMMRSTHALTMKLRSKRHRKKIFRRLI